MEEIIEEPVRTPVGECAVCEMTVYEQDGYVTDAEDNRYHLSCYTPAADIANGE